MPEFVYKTSGTCSTKIEFEISEDKKVKNIKFSGGCNGNLKAVSALCEGLEADELIKRLSGIKCGLKATSCADQLSRAIEQAAGSVK